MKKCAVHALSRILWLCVLIGVASSGAGQGDHPPMRGMKFKPPIPLDIPILADMP